MSNKSNHKSNVVTIGIATEIDTALPINFEILNNKIEKTELIPNDAKKAIKDYIKDSFNDLWNTFEELVEIQPPTELVEYWDIVLQIIQSLIT